MEWEAANVMKEAWVTAKPDFVVTIRWDAKG